MARICRNILKKKINIQGTFDGGEYYLHLENILDKQLPSTWWLAKYADFSLLYFFHNRLMQFPEDHPV